MVPRLCGVAMGSHSPFSGPSGRGPSPPICAGNLDHWPSTFLSRTIELDWPTALKDARQNFSGIRNLARYSVQFLQMSSLSTHQVRLLRETLTRHGIGAARVFGSVARGEATGSSDLDLLLEPVPGMTLVQLARLKMELEAAINMRVDLAFERSLPPRIAETVLREARPL